MFDVYDKQNNRKVIQAVTDLDIIKLMKEKENQRHPTLVSSQKPNPESKLSSKQI